MIFAQFYQRAVYPPESTKVIEACGDRAVIVLDGRERTATHHEISREECIKRGYLGYKLFKGETFTRSAPVSDYVECKKL